jgi:hypothetical protein
VKEVEKLKKDLDGKTLIGEFIGHPSFQHLVKYTRTTIIFYSVVENLKEELCWPPLDSKKLVESYGLDFVLT